MLTQEVHDCFDHDRSDAGVHRFHFSHLSRLLTVMLAGKIRLKRKQSNKIITRNYENVKLAKIHACNTIEDCIRGCNDMVYMSGSVQNFAIVVSILSNKHTDNRPITKRLLKSIMNFMSTLYKWISRL